VIEINNAPYRSHTAVPMTDQVQFPLPNRTALVALGDLRQAHIDLGRLPVPCVAFAHLQALQAV
jgi:hypothetical protein